MRQLNAKIQHHPLVLAALVLVIFLVLAVQAAAATPQYFIAAKVTHLGEVVAEPSMQLEENATARVHLESPSHSTMAARIRPANPGEVFLSMDFSSGKLSMQEDLVVPLGQPYRLTTDSLAIDLQVDLVED
jgi:hypothetical protein